MVVMMQKHDFGKMRGASKSRQDKRKEDAIWLWNILEFGITKRTLYKDEILWENENAKFKMEWVVNITEK